MNQNFILFLFFALIVISCGVQPQEITQTKNTKQKTTPNYTDALLRGSNTIYRDWWDVKHYSIVLAPDYKNKSLQGSVTMEFEMNRSEYDSVMQIDLQEPMQVTSFYQLVVNSSKSKTQNEVAIPADAVKKEGDRYFLDVKKFPQKNGNSLVLKMNFLGKPKIAKRPPWNGGWIFSEDNEGRPWMSVACQGEGASLWFPHKDIGDDEPDNGVTFTIIVPEELVAVANGRMWETSLIKGEPGTNVYTWEVTNPINTYNIVPYIGYYTHFTDSYNGLNGTLDLDYWVLDYNVEQAKRQFQQVKPMMKSFEDWMGPYPFYEDSYKLVEAPYLGMEHQSNIAYGNYFMNGYMGMDLSASGYGNKFDFIIIHESGHEWFGNNISVQDVADMWVHEGFTTYSEVMYVEDQFGLEAANKYVQGLRRNILNDKPIIGHYGVHEEGSGDMYYKGANIIHILRQLLEDDVKFKQIIRDLNKDFYHQMVTTKEVEDYLSKKTGIDLTQFFDQYLRTTNVPTLHFIKNDGEILFRWENVIDKFDMPVKLKNSNTWIYPNAEWKTYSGDSIPEIDPNFYINLKK